MAQTLTASHGRLPRTRQLEVTRSGGAGPGPNTDGTVQSDPLPDRSAVKHRFDT